MAKDAAELLSEIQSAVHQYLSLPGDTPLKGPFQDLLPQLDAGLQQLHGGGADSEDTGEAPEGAAPDAEDTGESPEPDMSSFKGASAAAMGDMKSARGEGDSKHGIPASFADHVKKKKAKAGASGTAYK